MAFPVNSCFYLVMFMATWRVAEVWIHITVYFYLTVHTRCSLISANKEALSFPILSSMAPMWERRADRSALSPIVRLNLLAPDKNQEVSKPPVHNWTVSLNAGVTAEIKSLSARLCLHPGERIGGRKGAFVWLVIPFIKIPILLTCLSHTKMTQAIEMNSYLFWLAFKKC